MKSASAWDTRRFWIPVSRPFSSKSGKKDDEVCPKSNGSPELFSCGWTLQEMMAPSSVRLFNRD